MGLARMRWHEEIPQALRLGDLLHILDHLDHFPALALVRLLVILRVAGCDLLVDKGPHAVPEIGFPIAQRKVHDASLLWLSRLRLNRTEFSVKPLNPLFRSGSEPRKSEMVLRNPLAPCDGNVKLDGWGKPILQ